MIYNCPTCTAALRFNPTMNKMECISCGNIYEVDELTSKTEPVEETMECNIYSCTACGAELAVNGVESSTFCAYCGQPTIVFNRVSSELKPRYIIPFSIPKEQAVNSIRAHLSKGFFVPAEIKDFDTGYLSGFYADCYDAKTKDIELLAVSRTKDLFNKEVFKTVNARNIQLESSNPKYKILKSEYAMFPAWFLTFRYQNEPYTILVNGQTGKVIGAVPYNKKKVTSFFTILAIISSFAATFFSYGLITGTRDISKIVICLLMGALLMFTGGTGQFAKVKRSISLSKSSTMNHFVKDRQEGN